MSFQSWVESWRWGNYDNYLSFLLLVKTDRTSRGMHREEFWSPFFHSDIQLPRLIFALKNMLFRKNKHKLLWILRLRNARFSKFFEWVDVPLWWLQQHRGVWKGEVPAHMMTLPIPLQSCQWAMKMMVEQLGLGTPFWVYWQTRIL